MKAFITLFLYCTPMSWSCRPEGSWPESPGKNSKKKDSNKTGNYFSPNNSWGGWTPPEGNDDWKQWIEKWGKYRTTDRPESDEWDSERGPDSNWPQNWRGYGTGIAGVPPPPWAYLPESYDKPEYCFHRPEYGDCIEDITRWGFNPTSGLCETFPYSGCGGNQNNFVSKARCVTACVDCAAPECEDDPGVNFEELVDLDLNV
ncbi:uncharacterized protein [Epargyreus clarus]|uniref:uncharacterized protein n=1 Tax=Epargyreus clarus TaxID=520877 RepID=UPI003C2CC79E